MLKATRRRSAGALLSLCMAAPPADAAASCDAQHAFKFDWDGQPSGSIGTASSPVYNVTNAAGTSVSMTMSFGGDTANITTVNFGGSVGAVATPYIGAVNVGGLSSSTEKTLSIGTIFDSYQTGIESGVDVAVITFAFNTPVRDVQFTILDIDYAANQFRDWVKITGTGPGGTFVPEIASPYGNNNSTNPGQTAPGVAIVGPYTATAPSFGNSEIVGNGSSAATDSFGNISATFPQPVTSVQIRYANGPAAYMSGTPGQQAIGIHDISFCPMPSLTLSKTAAPYVTAAADPKRFAAPGADMVYTLTVSNTGGSPVDPDTIVLDDVLPSQVSFYNGDIDDAGPLTGNFEFVGGSSGVTLPDTALSFSNNGGSSYGYTPASGYDTSVNAIRLRPQGAMAPNSSFTVRFRAQVK